LVKFSKNSKLSNCQKLITVTAVNALTCPSGYTSGDNDICYKVKLSYFEASASCESDGGRLVSIHNAFTNNLIQQLAQKEGVLVWLGLKCSDTVAKNCQWDDGQGPSYPYDAFYPGNPSVIGSCVLMMIGGQADGKWISGDCDNMQIGFACQVTQQVSLSSIHDICSCADFTEFGGQCYQVFDQPLPMATAESLCIEHCGHITSIHSNDENSMISTLVGAQTNYVLTGLVRQSSGSYNWTDHTAFDYNNFGNNNPAFGQCVAMSMVNELVNIGKWITVSCGQELPFVCKRGQTTTLSIGTLAPSTCDAPQFFDGRGSFYSPGYPASYQGTNPCIYILTVAPEDLVQIHFIDIQLGNGSTLEFYNSFVDTVPFNTISGDVPSSKYFTSSSNVMKMVYRAGKQAADRWEAEFLPANVPVFRFCLHGYITNPVDLYGGRLTAMFQITSPGYPGNYPALAQCHYELSTTPGNRILLTFGEINTEQCCDIISVYDYNETPYNPLLDRFDLFSGHIAAGVKVFTSTFNQMYVEFYTDSLVQDTGFTAAAVIAP
uniref:C-type lectin domain-containing protein n=1 Tax=Haemonchus placei TaxID=6290 RepID=A0A158QQP8_HAEPC